MCEAIFWASDLPAKRINRQNNTSPPSDLAVKMLLAEPPETAYDLRFSVLGFPVRIAVDVLARGDRLWLRALSRFCVDGRNRTGTIDGRLGLVCSAVDPDP